MQTFPQAHEIHFKNEIWVKGDLLHATIFFAYLSEKKMQEFKEQPIIIQLNESLVIIFTVFLVHYWVQLDNCLNFLSHFTSFSFAEERKIKKFHNFFSLSSFFNYFIFLSLLFLSFMHFQFKSFLIYFQFTHKCNFFSLFKLWMHLLPF